MKRIIVIALLLVFGACTSKQELQDTPLAKERAEQAVTQTSAAYRRAPASYVVGDALAPMHTDPQYKTVAEHAVTKTADQAVTTFSIDVDRASYANIRRFLTAGTLPPPAAVRIEEMLNYFTYRYPQPSGDVPFSITTEVAGTPWNTRSRLFRIGIQGRNLDEWKSAPNNLVFLIDTSGSMQPPNRLPLLKWRSACSSIACGQRIASRS
jgi:Ca-activated chloride channel homolog